MSAAAKPETCALCDRYAHGCGETEPHRSGIVRVYDATADRPAQYVCCYCTRQAVAEWSREYRERSGGARKPRPA